MKYRWYLVCKTKQYWNKRTNHDPGKPCVFPFHYNGTKYTKCTDVDSEKYGNSYFWCATGVTQGTNVLEINSHYWGECDGYCKTHGNFVLFDKPKVKYLIYWVAVDNISMF